jgi:hypothetical protein
MILEPFRHSRKLRRRPPPLERRTHIAVADVLRAFGDAGWWWSCIPSGEHRSVETGALLKRMGLQAGMFDFLLISPVGEHHWLELKRDRSAALSDEQRAFRRALEQRSVPHHVAHGFDDAIACLQAWGAVGKGMRLS